MSGSLGEREMLQELYFLCSYCLLNQRKNEIFFENFLP